MQIFTNFSRFFLTSIQIGTMVVCVTGSKPRDHEVVQKWLASASLQASVHVFSNATAVLASGCQGRLENSIVLVAEHNILVMGRTPQGEEVGKADYEHLCSSHIRTFI
jgi:hypothetical protein